MHTKLEKPLKYLKRAFYGVAGVAAVSAYTTFSALEEAKDLTITDTSIQSLDPQSSAIFVLTGKEGQRIEKGIEIAKKWNCSVYITGCNPDFKSTLTNMYQKSNPEVDITFGYQARTTVENAFEIKGWLEENPNIKNLFVVTSGPHITRAWQSLKKELPEDCQVKFIPAPTNYTSPSLTEFTKITVMSFCGGFHHNQEKEGYDARQTAPVNPGL